MHSSIEIPSPIINAEYTRRLIHNDTMQKGCMQCDMSSSMSNSNVSLQESSTSSSSDNRRRKKYRRSGFKDAEYFDYVVPQSGYYRPAPDGAYAAPVSYPSWGKKAGYAVGVESQFNQDEGYAPILTRDCPSVSMFLSRLLYLHILLWQSEEE